MKNHCFQFISVLIFCMSLSVLYSQNDMYVRPLNGIQTSYPITNIQKLTFSNGNFLITTISGAVGTHSISGNKYISFTDYTNTTPAPITYDQNFCNTATVANLTATGIAIKWYTSPTGGTALATTTALTTGTYYASQTIDTYESRIRTAIVVTVNILAAPAEDLTLNLCGDINPTISSLSIIDVKWYAVATGGTALADSTPILSGTTYYATKSINGCESVTRTAVLITNNPTPDPPFVFDQTVCLGATISNLFATGTNIKWYTYETGEYITPSTTLVSGIGTYFVTQTVNGCESDFNYDNPITVTVNNATTPAPNASAQTLCNSAKVANLVATGTAIKWYTAASGGTALVSTTALTTGTYYATQTVNTCESATRTAVAVTLNVTEAPTTSAQTFCNVAAKVTNLTAAGTAIKWYAVATGGTALVTSTALATGTYYATQTIKTCESATRTAVAVTVNVTAPPTASAQTFCNAATVANLAASFNLWPMVMAYPRITLVGTAAGGWPVGAQIDINQLMTNDGINYRIDSIPLTQGALKFRQDNSWTFNWGSPGFPSGIGVQDGSDIVVPSAGTYSVSFNRITGEYNFSKPIVVVKSFGWYATATGGNALVASTATATGIYYVSQTLDSCESATRRAVSVTVNVTPLPSASAQTFCNAATVANLTASGTAIKWYAAASGGSALSASAALASGTYYASQTLNSCESVARTAVAVTVNITPAPTVSPQTFSNAATVENLTATGTAIKWYTSPTGGTALVASSVLVTGTYYVTQTLNDCESNRTAVLVTVPTLDITEQQVEHSFCAYPNPVKNVLNLSGTIVGQLINSIDIISLEGQLILQQKQINNSAPQINVSSLPQGIYLCKIKCGNATEIIKFLKQ
jgi:hypothetical protein